MSKPDAIPALPKRKPKIKASVVIPNWNGVEFLENCLSSLAKQTFRNFEIIVIDNGSIDSSVSFIEKNFPEIKIIKLTKNIGFSPAVNLGILESRGEYIILINNDTKVDINCIKFLVEAAEKRKDVGMVAAKMLQFYNPNLIDSAGDYIDAVGHANNIGMGEQSSEYSSGDYVFLVTGGGGLFKREMLEKTGLFDNNYFAYFEDVDLCMRGQFLGYKGWFEPKAIIYHIHKATSNRNKAYAEYLQFRNMTQTIIKDFPAKLLFSNFNLIKIILVNINTVRYLSLHGYLGSAIKAEWYIIKNFFSLLKLRKIIQTTKVVTDDYIIQNVRPKKVTFFGLIRKGI